MEEWALIPEFPDYSVSTEGRVRSDRSNRIMALTHNQFGNLKVALFQDGRQYNRSVALLVASAFVEPYPRRPHFDTPINLNGNKSDCRAENLAWRPRYFAQRYHRQFDFPYVNTITRPVRDKNTGQIFESSLEACKFYGLLDRELVTSILHRTYCSPTYTEFEYVE